MYNKKIKHIGAEYHFILEIKVINI